MKCPHCAVELQMSERRGVEIDYCPTCRGVWLDRGELDKLLEHANREQASREFHVDEDDYRRRDRRAAPQDELPPKHAASYPKKRESFWSDLFDFG